MKTDAPRNGRHMAGEQPSGNPVAGKVIVITGASDGIGAAAARQLHADGATVVVIGRTAHKTRAVAGPLGAHFYLADFSRLDDVRRLAGQLRRDFPRIDVLANNAGGIMGGRTMTADGFEMTLQVNHLAHFLLTRLLLDRLIENRAVVLNTSSLAHRLFSDFDIDDLDMQKRYASIKAYGNAKLANVLFTKELHKRYHAFGMSTAAFHPGNVATGFAASSTSILKWVYQTPLKYLAGFIAPEKGADTLVWLAESTPGLDWQSGGYYYKREPSPMNPRAEDPELARQLWEKSEAMVRPWLDGAPIPQRLKP